jgi:hypothetical protein
MEKHKIQPLDELLEIHVSDQRARDAIRAINRKLRRREMTWQLTAGGFAVVLIAAFQRWI